MTHSAAPLHRGSTLGFIVVLVVLFLNFLVFASAHEAFRPFLIALVVDFNKHVLHCPLLFFLQEDHVFGAFPYTDLSVHGANQYECTSLGDCQANDFRYVSIQHMNLFEEIAVPIPNGPILTSSCEEVIRLFDKFQICN